jgi:hypothetical protein
LSSIRIIAAFDALPLADLDLPGASGNPRENSRQVSSGMTLAPPS